MYQEKLECVISPAIDDAGGGADAGTAGACAWSCGAGTCVAGACACPGAYAGARCEHYRCAAHCHRRGRCHLATTDNTTDHAHVGDADLPPLKVHTQPTLHWLFLLKRIYYLRQSFHTSIASKCDIEF